jgi:hypothetical protein
VTDSSSNSCFAVLGVVCGDDALVVADVPFVAVSFVVAALSVLVLALISVLLTALLPVLLKALLLVLLTALLPVLLTSLLLVLLTALLPMLLSVPFTALTVVLLRVLLSVLLAAPLLVPFSVLFEVLTAALVLVLLLSVLFPWLLTVLLSVFPETEPVCLVFGFSGSLYIRSTELSESAGLPTVLFDPTSAAFAVVDSTAFVTLICAVIRPGTLFKAMVCICGLGPWLASSFLVRSGTIFCMSIEGTFPVFASAVLFPVFAGSVLFPVFASAVLFAVLASPVLFPEPAGRGAVLCTALSLLVAS